MNNIHKYRPKSCDKFQRECISAVECMNQILYLNEQVAFAAGFIYRQAYYKPSAEKVSDKRSNSGNLNWQPHFAGIVLSSWLCETYIFTDWDNSVYWPKTWREFLPDSSRSQLAVDTFFCPSSRTWSGKQWQLSMESRCQLCFDQLKNCCTNCGVFIGCICCRCIADTITLIEQLCSCTQLNTKRLFFFWADSSIRSPVKLIKIPRTLTVLSL